MTAGSRLLLESVSPAVRKVLVRERIRAMQGDLDEALRGLDRAIEIAGDERVRDVVSLATVKAELLHLNRQDAEALRWYRERVLPLKARLEAEEQLVVDQNLADLELVTWSPDADATLYNLVDRRRLTSFDWFDAHDILSAHDAASAGKHYEALPIIWRQVVRAYLQGCWFSARWATRRMAEEALQLRSYVEASFHAVIAPHKELVERLAGGVLRQRDPGLVREIVRRLMTLANLSRHFVVACEFLQELADEIPDEELPPLVEWLLTRCAATQDGARAGSMLNMAWKALQGVAHRLSPELARRVAETAFAHSVWTTRLDNPDVVIIEREQMVKTVNQLTAAVDPEHLGWIAAEALPLALDRRQLSDYGHVINLLCHVARRGGSLIRDQIATALLPDGRTLDRMLIQAAPLLRDDRPAAESVVALANQVAGEIRNQVQFPGPGEEPIPVPETLMAHDTLVGGRRRVLHLGGGVGLHAVARHTELLTPEALENLVTAILTMATERENFLANRAGLLRGLMQFADRVGERARREICLALEPIAKGEIEEPTGVPTTAEVANPLNPMKWDFGKIGELRLVAILALAEFARHERTLTRLVAPVLEEAIYDEDADVRRGAYAAAAKLPEVSDTLLLVVLTGGRDPDPHVASAAFFAMAKQPTWELTRNHWRLFVHALRLAAQSADAMTRRNAAAASNAWVDRAPRNMQPAMRDIQSQFSRDICASVRESATRPMDASVAR